MCDQPIAVGCGRGGAILFGGQYCQRAKGIHVKGLERCDCPKHPRREIVVEDHTASPDPVGMVWLDFVAWLDSLGKRNRRIAEMLAADMPGKEVAEQFGISRGRTSRLRRELREDRRRFQSDAAA